MNTESATTVTGGAGFPVESFSMIVIVGRRTARTCRRGRILGAARRYSANGPTRVDPFAKLSSPSIT